MSATTSVEMKIIRKTDRNTRALAKVVSAAEYLLDLEAPFEALQILQTAKFAIIQERRNLRLALWAELAKRANVRS